MNQTIKYVCNECGKTHTVTIRQDCYYDNMFNGVENNGFKDGYEN